MQLHYYYLVIGLSNTTVEIQLQMYYLSGVYPSKNEHRGLFNLISYWWDPRLTWNATEYGIDTIQLEAKNIWTPFITVYDMEKISPVNFEIITVTSSGEITATFNFFIHGWCLIESEYFPYDWHTCTVQLSLRSIGVNLIHPYPGIELHQEISSGTPLWWVK